MSLRQIIEDEDPRLTLGESWSHRAESAHTFLTLRVNSENAAHARQLLHRCLGSRIELYTVHDDPRTGRCTFQVRLRRCSIEEVMDQVMAWLPEAEFGRICRGELGTLQ
jgi:hypothetical protein